MDLLNWKELIEKDHGLDVEGSWEIVQKIDSVGLLKIKEIDDKCLILYMIGDEVNQEKSLTEILIYVKKENRGDIRLLNEVKKFFEEEAIKNDCDCIKIGANFGYKDNSFGRILKRWGYEPDIYRKNI